MYSDFLIGNLTIGQGTCLLSSLFWAINIDGVCLAVTSMNNYLRGTLETSDIEIYD
mgnify:FL=1